MFNEILSPRSVILLLRLELLTLFLLKQKHKLQYLIHQATPQRSYQLDEVKHEALRLHF